MVGFSLSDGVLIMADVSSVHFFMNSKTSFLMETFELATFCFQRPEFRGKPGGRL